MAAPFVRRYLHMATLAILVLVFDYIVEEFSYVWLVLTYHPERVRSRIREHLSRELDIIHCRPGIYYFLKYFNY